MTRIVVLDCEAVQALASTTHPHHRRVVAHAQVVADRKRGSKPVRAVVPTAVRVEAKLDRRESSASFFNSLRITDSPLDSVGANTAARLHAQHRVSVVDAHVGATIAALDAEGDITVITSDPQDMRLVAGTTKITTVRL